MTEKKSELAPLIEQDGDPLGVLPSRSPVPRHYQLQKLEKSLVALALVGSVLWHSRLLAIANEITPLVAKSILFQLHLQMLIVALPLGLLYRYLTRKNFRKEVVCADGKYRLTYTGTSKQVQTVTEVLVGLVIGTVIWAVVGMFCVALAVAYR